MSGDGAPRVFVSYAHDSELHKIRVEAFARFLREDIGLDVHLDQWYDGPRIDWSLWAAKHLYQADFVLAVASPMYRRRADGEAPSDEGRGSQYEAGMIRDGLTKNVRKEIERILPVVLPGQSIDGIPRFLNPYSTTRYHVDEFTEAGVADLLVAITGRPKRPMPPRGPWRAGIAEERREVLLANGIDWLSNSQDVRFDSATIDGTRYEDSIVFRPQSATTAGFVEVDLGLRYRRLTATVGVLDDAVEVHQVGLFQILLDGRLRSECKAAVGKPGMIDVDVTGAMRLRLTMHRPGRAPELAWGNPTLL